MYIKEIFIKNFRNFKNISIPLNKFTILIGENDIGKSNLIEAIKLVLNNNTFQYASKTLKLSDFNRETIKEFKKEIQEDKEKIQTKLNEKDIKFINDIVPSIEIEATFVDASDDYQKALLSDWLNEDIKGECYKVKYVYKPKDESKFLEEILQIAEYGDDYLLPLNLYEYKIISSNNTKSVRYDKFQNFGMSYIGAERDDFSDTDKQASYKLISSLLEKNLDKMDKYKANEAYEEFFDKLQKLESFKNVFKKISDHEFNNFEDIINKLELGPNMPNLKSVFSNINMTYGEDFLYQKGLGTRNLVLIILLFTNYLNEDRKYNLISIEEPEAHMCINNINIAIDYMTKSIDTMEKNNYIQTIMTTHNYNIINKLKLKNVVVLKENKAINLCAYDEMSKYLCKRPNFDILKILFAKKVILVEGPTEEMLINTYLEKNKKILNMAEIIVTGKGFKKFLDIWKILNSGTKKKIGIVRDFDNQIQAKIEHEEYDDNNEIFVRTTKEYTFENDFVNQADNKEKLEKLFKNEIGDKDIEEYLLENKNKTESMYKICNEILENNLQIELPNHIKEIIDKICK